MAMRASRLLKLREALDICRSQYRLRSVQFIRLSSLQRQCIHSGHLYNFTCNSSRNFSAQTSVISRPESSELDKNDDEIEAEKFLENLSAEDEKRLKVLKLEYDVWLSMGKFVPLNVTNKMWLEVLRENPTPTSRGKVYKFWRKKEIYKEKAKQEKEEKAKNRSPSSEEDVDDVYHNKILQRVPFNSYPENNLAFAMMNGPHLVFDMGYTHMNHREMKNTIDQLQECHGFNKREREPFHLHFCNINSPQVVDAFKHHFSSYNSLLYTYTDKSYMECYPPEKLVYLSPNSPHLLHEYNHNDVYIIGGIVDRIQRPVSYASAKKDKIRSARLPLDKYINWKQGVKCLTLDQMLKIMLTLKKTNNWSDALKHVPTRKVHKLYDE